MLQFPSCKCINSSYPFYTVSLKNTNHYHTDDLTEPVIFLIKLNNKNEFVGELSRKVSSWSVQQMGCLQLILLSS